MKKIITLLTLLQGLCLFSAANSDRKAVLLQNIALQDPNFSRTYLPIDKIDRIILDLQAKDKLFVTSKIKRSWEEWKINPNGTSQIIDTSPSTYSSHALHVNNKGPLFLKTHWVTYEGRKQPEVSINGRIIDIHNALAKTPIYDNLGRTHKKNKDEVPIGSKLETIENNFMPKRARFDSAGSRIAIGAHGRFRSDRNHNYQNNIDILGRKKKNFSTEEISLWNALSGKEIGTPLFIDAGYSHEPAFAIKPGINNIMAIQVDKNTLALWDHNAHKIIKTQETPNDIVEEPSMIKEAGEVVEREQEIQDIVYSPNGNYIAIQKGYPYWMGKTKHRNKTPQSLQIWDASLEQKIVEFNEPKTSRTYAFAFSPDSKYLAIGQTNYITSSVILWDLESNQQIGQTIVPQNESREISAITFGPNNQKLYIGLEGFGYDKTTRYPKIEIWDISSIVPTVAAAATSSLQYKAKERPRKYPKSAPPKLPVEILKMRASVGQVLETSKH